jgi:hypothetical protein
MSLPSFSPSQVDLSVLTAGSAAKDKVLRQGLHGGHDYRWPTTGRGCGRGRSPWLASWSLFAEEYGETMMSEGVASGRWGEAAHGLARSRLESGSRRNTNLMFLFWPGCTWPDKAWLQRLARQPNNQNLAYPRKRLGLEDNQTHPIWL